MDEDVRQQQVRVELEGMFINELNSLGNQACDLGLIVGHGYRAGQYEILCRDQVVMLPPNQALTYLRELIEQVKPVDLSKDTKDTE